MDQRDRMRAADTDREAVVALLRTALNEGRLALHEFDERVAEAYQAKTYADLDQLLSDLPTVAPVRQSQLAPTLPPPMVPPMPPPAPIHATPPGTMPRWLAAIWGTWAAAVGLNVVIWILVCFTTGGLFYFWPMWVAGPWGSLLVIATILAVRRGEPRRWSDKQARRQARREERRRRRGYRGY